MRLEHDRVHNNMVHESVQFVDPSQGRHDQPWPHRPGGKLPSYNIKIFIRMTNHSQIYFADKRW